MVGLILRQGSKLVLVGLAIGIAASIGAGLLIAQQLYEVSSTDPQVMVTVALILIAVALFASWLPARRATRVNPMVALRSE